VALVVLAALVGRGLLAAVVDIFPRLAAAATGLVAAQGAGLSKAHDEWAAESRHRRVVSDAQAY
jgi:hypothetical protein